MPAHRSSRASTARFAAVLALIGVLFVTGVAAGAAGAAMIIGSEANNAGSANTQLLTNSSVVAFKLLQNGPGTALMGYATPATGATRGVYGRTDSPNGDGVQARNGAAGLGTGAAIHAYGQANIGIIAESTTSVPLKLIGSIHEPPMSVNSATKVTNLNVDMLDDLTSSQFARSDQVATGHFVCPAVNMIPTADIGYATSGLTLRYPTAAGTFACGVLLPDGATVTAARWVVYDNSASGQVLACSLERQSLGVGVVNAQVMATGAATGIAAQPTYVTQVDLTVTNAVVDNATYSYVASCGVSGTTLSTSLFKFAVEYTVSGLPVW